MAVAVACECAIGYHIAPRSRPLASNACAGVRLRVCACVCSVCASVRVRAPQGVCGRVRAPGRVRVWGRGRGCRRVECICSRLRLLKGELDYKKKTHLRNYTVRYSIDIVTVITKQSKQQIAA